MWASYTCDVSQLLQITRWLSCSTLVLFENMPFPPWETASHRPVLCPLWAAQRWCGLVEPPAPPPEFWKSSPGARDSCWSSIMFGSLSSAVEMAWARRTWSTVFMPDATVQLLFCIVEALVEVQKQIVLQQVNRQIVITFKRWVTLKLMEESQEGKGPLQNAHKGYFYQNVTPTANSQGHLVYCLYFCLLNSRPDYTVVLQVFLRCYKSQCVLYTTRDDAPHNVKDVE